MTRLLVIAARLGFLLTAVIVLSLAGAWLAGGLTALFARPETLRAAGQTILLAFTATLVAAPLGAMLAMLEAEDARPNTTGLATTLVGGLPSVSIGVAMTVVASALNETATLLNFGVLSVLLGVLIMPVAYQRVRDAFHAVPIMQRENAVALGLHRAQVLRQIVMPAIWPSMVAAALTCMARASGAAVLPWFFAQGGASIRTLATQVISGDVQSIFCVGGVIALLAWTLHAISARFEAIGKQRREPLL